MITYLVSANISRRLNDNNFCSVYILCGKRVWAKKSRYSEGQKSYNILKSNKGLQMASHASTSHSIKIFQFLGKKKPWEYQILFKCFNCFKCY